MQNNWLNKIHNLETPPSREAWLNIAQQLDKENTLKAKLLAYETASPISILKNIFYQLDVRERTSIAKVKNVIPLYSKNKKVNIFYFRIAAAVIAIVWISIAVNNKRNINDTVAVSNAKETENILLKKVGNQATVSSTLPIANSSQKRKAAAMSINKIVDLPPFQNITTNQLKRNEVQNLAQSPSENKKEKLQNAQGQTPMNIALLNVPNTNTGITGANEQTAKTTSKFSNLLSNSQTKENLDLIIEECPKWRRKMAAWRIKMANNPVPLSISNFADLVQMTEVLEQDN